MNFRPSAFSSSNGLLFRASAHIADIIGTSTYTIAQIHGRLNLTRESRVLAIDKQNAAQKTNNISIVKQWEMKAAALDRELKRIIEGYIAKILLDIGAIHISEATYLTLVETGERILQEECRTLQTSSLTNSVVHKTLIQTFISNLAEVYTLNRAKELIENSEFDLKELPYKFKTIRCTRNLASRKYVKKEIVGTHFRRIGR